MTNTCLNSQKKNLAGPFRPAGGAPKSSGKGSDYGTIGSDKRKYFSPEFAGQARRSRKPRQMLGGRGGGTLSEYPSHGTDGYELDRVVAKVNIHIIDLCVSARSVHVELNYN